MSQIGRDDIDLYQLGENLSQIAKALDDIVENFTSAGEVISMFASNIERISALLRDYESRYLDDGR